MLVEVRQSAGNPKQPLLDLVETLSDGPTVLTPALLQTILLPCVPSPWRGSYGSPDKESQTTARELLGIPSPGSSHAARAAPCSLHTPRSQSDTALWLAIHSSMVKVLFTVVAALATSECRRMCYVCQMNLEPLKDIAFCT